MWPLTSPYGQKIVRTRKLGETVWRIPAEIGVIPAGRRKGEAAFLKVVPGIFGTNYRMVDSKGRWASDDNVTFSPGITFVSTMPTALVQYDQAEKSAKPVNMHNLPP
jgi:hypothetical protein